MKLLILLFTSSLTVMAGATLAPALPALALHFDPTGERAVLVRLVLTLPALATAIAAPFAGTLLDRFGRKLPLLAFIGVYALAGSSGLFFASLEAILVGRALLGVAVAGVMTASIAMLSDLYAGSERNRVLGIQSACMAGGGVLFLSAGGVLADVSWRAPFALYLAAIPLVLLVARWVPETLDRAARAQARSDATHAAPLDRRDTAILAALCGVMFVGMLAFYAVPVQLPFRLQEFDGVGASRTGLALAGMTLAGAFGALQFRRVREHVGTAAIYALVFLAVAVGFGIFWRATHPLQIAGGLIVLGLGTGMLMPNTNVRANLRLPARVRGRAAGAITTSAFLGQFVSPLITQPLVQRLGLGAMFGVMGAAALVLALVFLALSRFAPTTLPIAQERGTGGA